MTDEQDLNPQRTRLMEKWHEYCQTFNSFVPEEQPFPDDWEGSETGQLGGPGHLI